jgi:hypothetical protein
MPRKKPLPQRELEISARLKWFRLISLYPRRLFAHQAALDSSIIARIELGRTPIRYEVGRQLCLVHSINPNWLATGKEDVPWRWPLPRADELGVSPSALFSAVFDAHLQHNLQPGSLPGPRFPKTLQEHIEELGQDIAIMLCSRDHSPTTLLAALVDVLKNPLPVPEINLAIARHLADWLNQKPADASGPNISMKNRPTLHSLLAPGQLLYPHFKHVLRLAAKESSKEGLTDSATSGNLEAVNNQWPLLKRRLQKATAAPGSKSKLAKFLKVELSRVSQWLSDASSAREPGAEYALEMLHWVQQQERQQ